MIKVYDNGDLILGRKKDVETYLKNTMFTSDLEFKIYEILKDIEEEKEDTILCINYNTAWSDYSIDYWYEDRDVKEI